MVWLVSFQLEDWALIIFCSVRARLAISALLCGIGAAASHHHTPTCLCLQFPCHGSSACVPDCRYGFNPGSQLVLVGLQNSFAVSNCAVTTTLAPAAAGLSALLVKAIDSHVSTGEHPPPLSRAPTMRQGSAAQRPPGQACLHCISRAAP